MVRLDGSVQCRPRVARRFLFSVEVIGFRLFLGCLFGLFVVGGLSGRSGLCSVR